MLKDLSRRRALRVLREAQEALAAGPLTSSSPRPKPVPLPVKGHSTPTLPSLNRLLGRPVQPPSLAKEKKSKGKPTASTEKEDMKTPPALSLKVPSLHFRSSTKGKEVAWDNGMLSKSLAAHMGSSWTRPSVELVDEEPLKRQPPKWVDPTGAAADSSALSTGFARENWLSEPWEKGQVGARDPKKHLLDALAKRSKKTKPVPPHIRPILAKREALGVLEPIEESILEDVIQDQPQPPIAVLSHGLDRVLFNPGVHWLQDPRSRVYNFTPWLQPVPSVSDFDFNRIPAFVPSSRDNDLFGLAKRQGRRFAGSTSSLTGVLGQCYFLISGEKEVDLSILSDDFKNKSKKFTPAQRWPASVKLSYKEGVYTIDSAKSEMDLPEKNILLWLGTILEKFLTISPGEFGKLLRSTPIPEATIAELQKEREAYRYAQTNDFVMRSQLDCYDARLPGTGVFDIKTRACTPTRLDVLNYEEHKGYTIKKMHGQLESFEKEYYDLVRSAMLKYSFQVRIGGMDGVIVAYHNTQTLFGFQYIPLSEMDERLFGPGDSVGDRVFDKCVGLMEKVMDEVVGCFGRQSCNATFFTKEDTEAMYVWVEPAEWEGDEDMKPVEQLRVEVKSYLGEDPVPGHRAVSHCWKPDSPWTMEYKIQRLDVDQAKARRDLASAKEKMFKAHIVPSGVDAEDLEEYWQTLAHGNATERHSSGVDFDPSQFQVAIPPYIQMLRDVSRKGREEQERLEEMYKDEPKVVLGNSARG